MNAKNTFRAIGVCYSDPKFYKWDNDTYAVVIIATKMNDGKVKYLPITARKENADVLLRLGRNGNLIAVNGFIDSKEYFDKTKGVSTLRISFIMEDMMVIEKMNPTRLTNKRIEDLLETFNLE